MINPFAKLKEAFLENDEVIKLRQQFSEMDAKTQSYTIFGAMGFAALCLIGIMSLLVASTLSLRNQMTELNDSIRFLNQSSEKMEEMRQKIRAQSSTGDDLGLDASSSLTEVAEKIAGKSAIGKDSFELPAENTPGSSLEVKLNKISLRQLTRFFFYLENSKTGIATPQVTIETRNDPEGYLWAAFKLAREASAGKGKSK